MTANTHTMQASSASFKQLQAAQQDALHNDTVPSAHASMAAASAALDAVQEHLAHGRLALH